MEGGEFKCGLQKFLTTCGIKRAPAEESGVLERLAPTDVRGEGGQADALGESGEIFAQDGARLDLVKKNSGGSAGRQVTADYGDGVLRSPEIGRRGRAHEERTVGLGQGLVEQGRIELGRCINDQNTMVAAGSGEFDIVGLADPACGGALRVAIKQGNAMTRLAKGGCEEDGERGFAGATLAVADGDFHSRKSGALQPGALDEGIKKLPS